MASKETPEQREHRLRKVPGETSDARAKRLRSEYAQVNADRLREYRRQHREANRERAREYRREYRNANLEREREYKRNWMREARAREKANPAETARRREEKALRETKQEERRRKDRERAKAWAEKNPERLREQQRAWDERNKERRREIARNYYHRHRDEVRAAMRERNAERRRDPAVIAGRKEYVANNREHLNALQRARREANRGAVNKDQQERKRIEKRRIELGLPKIPRHRSLKNDRREHEQSAEQFFSRRRTAEHKRKLRTEREKVELATHRAQVVDERAAAAAGEKVLRGYLAHKLVSDTITQYLQTADGARLREEVRMDLIARRARGGGHVDPAVEARRRATPICVEALNEKLKMKMVIPKPAGREMKQNRTGTPQDTGPVTGIPGAHKPGPRVR